MRASLPRWWRPHRPNGLALEKLLPGHCDAGTCLHRALSLPECQGLTGGPQGRTFRSGLLAISRLPNKTISLAWHSPLARSISCWILPILGLSALFVATSWRSRAGRPSSCARQRRGCVHHGSHLFEQDGSLPFSPHFLAGIAGALFASYSRISSPIIGTCTLSIQFVAAIIIEASQRVGSILGAAFVFALPLMLDQFSLLPPSSSSNSLSEVT